MQSVLEQMPCPRDSLHVWFNRIFECATWLKTVLKHYRVMCLRSMGSRPGANCDDGPDDADRCCYEFGKNIRMFEVFCMMACDARRAGRQTSATACLALACCVRVRIFFFYDTQNHAYRPKEKNWENTKHQP